MKLYGGIDLHSNNCVVTLVDEAGQKVLGKRVENDLTKMITLLEPIGMKLQG
jgi:transposase